MTFQSQSAVMTPAEALQAENPLVVDPQPLVPTGRNWTRWVGSAISLLVLAAVIYQLRYLNMREVLGMIPPKPAFWLAFVISYCSTPMSEWVIFRRLWSIPAEGFVALLRKRVSNEILLGYSGEVYFYAWARGNARITAAPFGAIKDVTILSALAGNLVTLAMLVVAAPLLPGSLHLGIDAKMFMVSVGIIMATSFLFMLLRKRLFSLPRKDLIFVMLVHLGRIIGGIVLTAYMWHLILPQVALTWWVLLSTLRQLLGRLPLVPNKDVVFVGVAVFLVGRDQEIAAMMAIMASMVLATHLLVGGVLGATGLFRTEHTA
jgi:hypothetical protein